MKTRVTLMVAGLVWVGIAGIYLLRATAPDPAGRPTHIESAALAPEPAAGKSEATAQAAEDVRRSETVAAYAELEVSRKDLQKQLSDLKAVLWGRELPVAQARTISRDMMSAQHLLRNPPLQGAFLDAAGVHAEKDRVDAARVQLQEISRTVGELKAP